MTAAKPPRHRMKIETSAIQSVQTGEHRIIQTGDARSLARLMHESYKGTIDYEGETPEQCRDEMEGTLTGKYGDFLDFASFLIEDANGIQSASLVTLYHEKPLLAYSMTVPDSQGKGMAGMLIRRSISALAKNGYPELFLVVTEGNRAESLYKKLGFKLI